MKRIGILGGTFNPVHIGHLAMAQAALEKFRLDKVIFIPCNRPPHKKIIHLAPGQERFKMVQAAVRNNPLFEVSDFEIKRKGKSYSIDTVEYLRSVYPKKTKFFFIIGTDSFRGLRSWKRVDEIRKLTSFIVVNREGHAPAGRFSVNMPGIDVSSSYLRGRIRQGKSVRYFVPDNVIRYIQQHKLYKAD